MAAQQHLHNASWPFRLLLCLCVGRRGCLAWFGSVCPTPGLDLLRGSGDHPKLWQGWQQAFAVNTLASDQRGRRSLLASEGSRRRPHHPCLAATRPQVARVSPLLFCSICTQMSWRQVPPLAHHGVGSYVPVAPLTNVTREGKKIRNRAQVVARRHDPSHLGLQRAWQAAPVKILHRDCEASRRLVKLPSQPLSSLQGCFRLARDFDPQLLLLQEDRRQQEVIQEVFRMVSRRGPNSCNFLEGGT